MLAKAIVDDMRIGTQFNSSFYKHILGQPVCLDDVAEIDPQLFESLSWILQHTVDGMDLELYFDTTVERFGEEVVVELIPGGSTLPVTDANKEEFVVACSNFALVGMVQVQGCVA
eukprot:SAG31_NODE_31280_length_370_cov_0.571956_1_plen_115_part_00